MIYQLNKNAKTNSGKVRWTWYKKYGIYVCLFVHFRKGVIWVSHLNISTILFVSTVNILLCRLVGFIIDYPALSSITSSYFLFCSRKDPKWAEDTPFLSPPFNKSIQLWGGHLRVTPTSHIIHSINKPVLLYWVVGKKCILEIGLTFLYIFTNLLFLMW